MKNLIVAFILFIPCYIYGQAEYTSLSDAMKNPAGADAVIFQSSDNINKFIKRKDKFSQLATVYIQHGFAADELGALIAALKDTELQEVIIECDTLTQQVALLGQLQQTGRITLIAPYILKRAALYDIGKLQSPSLSLKSSAEIILPEDFCFNPALEEIEILAKDTRGHNAVINKLAGLNKLVSLSISTDSITGLPNLARLTSLKNLEVIKTSDMDKPEEKLFTQKLRMAKEANECSSLVTVNFNTTTVLTEAEKASLTNTFGGFYFVTDKPETVKTPTAKNSTEIPQETFETLVGFKPLVMQTDVKRSKFTFNTEQPVKINALSGTVICIPANAFVDADGNPVTGDVQVTYREIKTPLDMLVSGVPMAYDSGGMVNQFQSAGNFEILAFQNGEPLQLGNNQTIEMNFASADEERDYNFYQLDAESGNWEYKEAANAKPDAAADNKKTKTKEQVLFEEEKPFEYKFDTSRYDTRFADLNYRYMLDSVEASGSVFEMNKGKRYAWREMKVNTKSPLVKVAVEYTGEKDTIRQVKFKIIPKIKKKTNDKYFPELTAFKGYTFYSDEESTRRLFRNKYVKKKKYYDVRILYNSGDEYCTLQLKTDTGFVNITADITEGENGLKAQYRKSVFARRYKRYARSLNKRIERLNNGLEYRKESARAAFNRRNTPGNMASSELYYSREGRRKQLRGDFTSGGSVNADVMRSLTLNRLGVFNIDKFYKYKTPPAVLVNVMVKTDSNKTFKPETVYIIDDRINGLLTFSSYSVSLYKRYTKTIIAIDNEQNIYCIDKPAKEAIDNNTIFMKKLNKDEIKSPAQFAKMVGL